MQDFYAQQTAVMVSPHHLRKDIMKGKNDFILVDLRSAEEFSHSRIKGAINIPAYASPRKSAYGDVERIVGAFKNLPKDKDIIVYCYSEPCMTGRKIGKLLADNGIYVRHLGIGWNEWRHHWTGWNHEHEWAETDVEQYVDVGEKSSSPKVYSSSQSSACSLEGELGC